MFLLKKCYGFAEVWAICGLLLVASPAWAKHRATAITKCVEIRGGGDYELQRDIGGDPTTVCLAFGDASDIHIDLNGHKIVGRVVNPPKMSGVPGLALHGGAVECNYATQSGVDQGCIEIAGYSNPSFKSPVSIYDLTVSNNIDPGERGRSSIFVTWDLDNYSGPGAAFRLYGIDAKAGDAPDSVRTPIIYYVGKPAVAVFHSRLECDGLSAACQGVVLYGGGAKQHEIFENELEMDPAKHTNDTARGVVCDTGARCRIYNNRCVANNNRCFRIRENKGSEIVGNTIEEILPTPNSTHTGAIHLGDQDDLKTTYDLGGLRIEGNWFELKGGTAIWIRSAKNVTVANNAFTNDGEDEAVALRAVDYATAGSTVAFRTNEVQAGVVIQTDKNSTLVREAPVETRR